MGIMCELKKIFFSLDHSDWVELFGVLVNSCIGYYIVRSIQNNLANKRVLKDHFISEVKEIRDEYRTYLNQLCSNKVSPKNVTTWFKVMNIKVNDLMKLMNDVYKIDANLLSPYQNDLRDLITENEEFESQFSTATTLNFSQASKNKFIRFQQENNKLINQIIITINDAG